MTAGHAPDGPAERGADQSGASGSAEAVADETVVSARRQPATPDLPDDATVVSGRRRHPLPDVDDDTAPSTRGAASVPSDLVDDTVVSRRMPPAGVDTVPEEDTVLRPARAADSRRAPEAPSEAAIGREALVADAEALRAPTRPRAVPPVTAVRAPVPPRPPVSGVPAPASDRESVEGAARARARRRVLIVVLCAAAGAIAATVALVLLLT